MIALLHDPLLLSADMLLLLMWFVEVSEVTEIIAYQ